jgi:pyruvate dehydrogenase E2 component (dihydrolipoyllysine-residue acetyltransferase)
MPFTFTMPKLSPTMEVGTIAKWLKKEGDYVKPGEVLIEVATDKATVEHEALDPGYLRKIIVKEGGEAAVNQAIAIFSENKEESIEGYLPKPVEVQEPVPAPVAEKKEQPAAKPARAEARFEPAAPLTNYTFDRQVEPGRLKASPLAKRLAKERGLDLTTLKGSGPGDRIVSRDLDKAPKAPAIPFGKREVPTIPPGSYEEEALTPMRRVIGQRLQESKSFIPHFYITQTVDAEPLVNLREQLKKLEINVTYNDLAIRACAMALREHPEVNSGFNSVNQTLIRFQTIDISIAVSVDGGLITPIIRHADYKTVSEISAEVKALASRAKEGKLEEFEYKGGSFTVSNLGMYGVTDFIGVINPPQAALLAVGGIQEVPVVKNGQVVPGKTLNITLSADHRVVDGALGADFIRTLKGILENPVALIIH